VSVKLKPGHEYCEDCDGAGEVECPHCDGMGEIDCETCDGQGQFPLDPNVCTATWIDMSVEPWREQQCDRELGEFEKGWGYSACAEHRRQQSWQAKAILAPLEVRA
jgi:RecJ-like exonuclease